MSEDNLEPIFISVKKAAQMLAIEPASVYALLDQQAIESQYFRKRRLVVLTSLREYAAALPRTRESA